MSTKQTSGMKRVLSVIIYLIFLFLVLEGSARLIGPLHLYSNRVQFAMVVPHPDRVYGLHPSQQWVEDGVIFKTNSAGFRGNEFMYEKQPNAVRIATMGDSVTYGWNVNEEEDYPSVLESLLNKNCPNIKFEVYNFGVPGYGAVQQAALIDGVLKYKPDIVLLQFSQDDFKRADISHGKEGFTEIFYIQEPFLVTGTSIDKIIIPSIRKSAFLSLVSQVLHRITRKIGSNLKESTELYTELDPTISAVQLIEAKSMYQNISLIIWIHPGIYINGSNEIFQILVNSSNTELTRIIPPRENRKDYLIDDIHPNSKGYTVIAETLFNEVSVQLCSNKGDVIPHIYSLPVN